MLQVLKFDIFITKLDSYYKMRRFYDKMRQLIQIASVHMF